MYEIVQGRNRPVRGQRAQPRRDIVLALGLVLSPGTQLRIDGLPIGPGEILIVLWLSLSIILRTYSYSLKPTMALRRIVFFWVVIAIAESIGMVVGLNIELYKDWNGVVLDIIAFTLMFSFGLMYAIEFADDDRRRRFVWLLVSVGSAVLMLQLVNGQGIAVPPGVNPWYHDRLTGWSENPNQLGLLSAVITILAVDLYDKAINVTESSGALICASIAVVVGIMTSSDSYILSLLSGGIAYVTLRLVIWIRTPRDNFTLQGTVMVLVVILLPLIFAAAAPFLSAVRDRIVDQSIEVYSENDQGDTRLNLWAEAYEKGIEAGMLGMGPGPHLTSKSSKRPPPEKFEAHNTPLDLFTQGGFLALFGYIWLTVSAFVGAWRAGQPAMAALVVSIVVFGLFHFVIRHPIFWFAIILCLLEAGGVRKAAHGHAARPAKRILRRRPAP